MPKVDAVLEGVEAPKRPAPVNKKMKDFDNLVAGFLIPANVGKAVKLSLGEGDKSDRSVRTSIYHAVSRMIPEGADVSDFTETWTDPRDEKVVFVRVKRQLGGAVKVAATTNSGS